MKHTTRRLGVILASFACIVTFMQGVSFANAFAGPSIHQKLFARPHVFAVSQIQTIWSQTLDDSGYPVALSSPNVANLDGKPSVVIGDRAGNVYAFHLSDGSAVSGWPFHAGGAIDATPSVAPINPGNLDSVFVGVGNSANPTVGGYQAISPTGSSQWYVPQYNPSTDPTTQNGVQSSMTVGNLQGSTDVISGSMGENEFAMNAQSGSILPGFPWYEADSNFTTPAIGDVLGNGQNQIIEGGDSTAGLSYNTTYQNGGHIRVLAPTGNLNQPTPNGGLICQYNTNQVVQSSPAVGIVGSQNTYSIIAGTGMYYQGVSDTNRLISVNASNCSLDWSVQLDGATNSSPALADVLGNGQLQVIEGTNIGSGSGSIWVLDGDNGSTIWQAPTTGAVIGSAVTADLSGSGYQDLLVPTTLGIDIFDGKTGSDLGVIGATSFIGFQNSPLITDDPNGSIGITVAGYNSSNQGVIYHFELPSSNGASVNEVGAWPMFHHDPQLSGLAPTVPAVVAMAPTSDGKGYWEVDSAGNVYPFGDATLYGSASNLTLSAPISAFAVDSSSTGYVLVGADGSIFTYGSASYFGSSGQINPGLPAGGSNSTILTKPIVGAGEAANNSGYWLVASDGGIFAFGSAKFYGSMGGKPLNKPVVGMTATSDGKGYWLVASDGGIFAFGDAQFYGSTGSLNLNMPIVGMTATSDGKGYWFVASDGGIFAFGDAQFYGSLGNKQISKPIVGLAMTPDGLGYWMVDSAGGIYPFGDAPNLGSRIRL